MTNKDLFLNWLNLFCTENSIPTSKKEWVYFLCFEEYSNCKHLRNYRLVLEDRWLQNVNAVKSKIVSDFGKSKCIYARSTEAELVSKKVAKKFLNKHHSYGYAKSKRHLALIYKGEIVAIASFAAERMFDTGASAEMVRFCNKSFVTVVGGLSKLIYAYIRFFEPKDIMTYADIERGSGAAFEKLGFKAVSRKKPIAFLCHTKTGQRIPKKLFNDFENRCLYVSYVNAGSIKYVLKTNKCLRAGSY